MQNPLEEKLDRVFSTYIRLKYSDYSGFVSCFTCEDRKHWTEIDAGHFIGRSNRSVRWDEDNVRPQCVMDNRFRGGMEEAFEEHLRDDIGDEAVDELLERGRREKQFDENEYRELIHKFTLEIERKGGKI